MSNEPSNYRGANRQSRLDDRGIISTPAREIDDHLACFTPKRSLGSNPVSPTDADRPLTSRNTTVGASFIWCIARFVPDGRPLAPT